MSAIEFLQLILTLKVRYKFSVTSWIRSPKRNRAKGGSSNSRHLLGLAVDVVLDNKSDKYQFKKECTRLGLKWLDEGDHIHVQTQ